MKPARRVILLLLIIGITALALALLATGCAPAQPPECARLDLEYNSGVAVCIGEVVSVELADSSRVEISLLAVGSRDDLGGPAFSGEAAMPEGHAPPTSTAERLLSWIIGAGMLLVAALFVLAVGALLFARKVGRALVVLLAALALPALAEAQAPLAPGMLTHWCSGDGRCNPGTTRITRAVPAIPCDPWADGRFHETDPVDLTCWRQRYADPLSRPGWYGTWCGQHSPCDSISTQWSTTDPRQWTWGGGCLEPGSLGRAACDAIHTAGATLGCTMLPCGVVSCPAAPRTCPVIATGADGYHRAPLLTLPPNRRGPPDTRTVGSQAAGPADACAWIGFQSTPIMRLVRPPNAVCCAGMPPECCMPDGFGPECWEAPTPDPEPPVEPPAPAVALEVIDCDATGWRVRTADGETRVGLGAEVEVDGVTVRLPAACSGECPEAEALERVRAEVCEPVAIRNDCLACHPLYGCHPSCPPMEGWS